MVVANALTLCAQTPQGGTPTPARSPSPPAGGAAPARSGGGMPGATPQLDTLTLPPGFSVEVYTSDVPGARSMALAPDGTLFVGTRRSTVYAVLDRDKNMKADGVVSWSTSLKTPNGLAFRDGALYVGELNRIVRFDNVLDAVASGAGSQLTPKVIVDNLPSDLPHGWKYIAFGPDGYLYFQVGAPCNVCLRPDPYAAILRVKPDGTGQEIFARGVRNSVGLAWHPDTKELWFTDNGRDLLGDHTPSDELNHAPKAGLHFGFPHCHEGATPDPDPQIVSGRSCAEFAPPAHQLGPHVAALGLTFYRGAMFPPEYKTRLFIVNHGSWNRTPDAGPSGYRIMTATVQGQKVVKYEPFATGFLQGRLAWGRPVDLLEMPDGSLLVSDDTSGAIYRITYSKK
jgi:glucose/arabinose dehydrogenase